MTDFNIPDIVRTRIASKDERVLRADVEFLTRYLEIIAEELKAYETIFALKELSMADKAPYLATLEIYKTISNNINIMIKWYNDIELHNNVGTFEYVRNRSVTLKYNFEHDFMVHCSKPL